MRGAAKTPPDPAALARLSADSLYNSTLRTTCVATRLEAGHATNALPQMARATVNCRVLPGEKPEDVQATLVRVLASDKITVTATGEFISSPPSPINPELHESGGADHQRDVAGGAGDSQHEQRGHRQPLAAQRRHRELRRVRPRSTRGTAGPTARTST